MCSKYVLKAGPYSGIEKDALPDPEDIQAQDRERGGTAGRDDPHVFMFLSFWRNFYVGRYFHLNRALIII
jgi:hypothetical protein